MGEAQPVGYGSTVRHFVQQGFDQYGHCKRGCEPGCHHAREENLTKYDCVHVCMYVCMYVQQVTLNPKP